MRTGHNCNPKANWKFDPPQWGLGTNSFLRSGWSNSLLFSKSPFKLEEFYNLLWTCRLRSRMWSRLLGFLRWQCNSLQQTIPQVTLFSCVPISDLFLLWIFCVKLNAVYYFIILRDKIGFVNRNYWHGSDHHWGILEWENEEGESGVGHTKPPYGEVDNWRVVSSADGGLWNK